MVNDPLVKPAFPGGKRGIQGVFLAPEEFKMMQFFKGYYLCFVQDKHIQKKR